MNSLDGLRIAVMHFYGERFDQNKEVFSTLNIPALRYAARKNLRV